MTLIYYGIRHKATGELMPQAKKNRGYSNWNPSKQEYEFTASLGFPRLLQSRKQAQNCINQWNAIPNGNMRHDYEGEVDLETKDDGRKKEDLEIVEIELRVK